MNTTDPDRAWIVSWAAPAGVAIPATSAHRTLAGARRRIRAELLAAGDPAALAVEETVRGVVTGDTGELGSLVYTLTEVGLGPAPVETVFVLEWAGPVGSTLPATMTAHRSEAGVRAAIAAAAAELGVEPVEDERPGPMRMIWVGDLVAMVRSTELWPL